MKTMLSALVLCSALVACNAVPEKIKAPEPDDFSQSYEESIKPANGISAKTLADWKAIDKQMQALVPGKAALFSEVLFQNEIHSVSANDKRQAGLKLSQAGKSYLADLKEKCWVFNATQTKSSTDNSSETIRGALGLSGDGCSLVISDNQETKLTVTARTDDFERFSASTNQVTKFAVNDAAIATAAGFTSSTSTVQIKGNFVRYPKTSYQYASAKIILRGTFSVVLAGETVSGTITGEVKMNSTASANLKAVPAKPSAQFLLEANSSQGAIRLVTKRINNVNHYFFNGAEVSAAAVPSFLIIADDYLK
jgi:hypothetical protein